MSITKSYSCHNLLTIEHMQLLPIKAKLICDQLIKFTTSKAQTYMKISQTFALKKLILEKKN